MITILVVDDSLIVRRDLKKIIINAGLKVAGEAEDGNVAFKKYKELKPDLVLLDITMPQCNGIESLKLIKKYDNLAKVIMVTAMENRLAILETMKLGAIDYIIKPFAEKRVKLAIQKAFET